MNKSIKQIIEEGGAKCEICGQRMLKSKGCKCSTIKCNGKYYKRIKCGEEEFAGGNTCHDCGATNGNYHHYNCDMETCPVCGNQLIGCECDIEFVECE